MLHALGTINKTPREHQRLLSIHDVLVDLRPFNMSLSVILAYASGVNRADAQVRSNVLGNVDAAEEPPFSQAIRSSYQMTTVVWRDVVAYRPLSAGRNMLSRQDAALQDLRLVPLEGQDRVFPMRAEAQWAKRPEAHAGESAPYDVKQLGDLQVGIRRETVQSRYGGFLG